MAISQYFDACETRGHHYFVADVAVVEDEGKVVVLALCTACGNLISEECQVTLNKLGIYLTKGK